jgi:nitroreductase
MDFLNLVKKRQSTRRYLDKPVERDKIERCIEAARLAPSATNTQPWKFIVVDNLELRGKVANKTFNQIVSFNRFSLQAPVLIVITSNRMNISNKITQTLKNRELTPIDIGIAAEHICLQAAEEGLGTCLV